MQGDTWVGVDKSISGVSLDKGATWHTVSTDFYYMTTSFRYLGMNSAQVQLTESYDTDSDYKHHYYHSDKLVAPYSLRVPSIQFDVFAAARNFTPLYINEGYLTWASGDQISVVHDPCGNYPSAPKVLGSDVDPGGGFNGSNLTIPYPGNPWSCPTTFELTRGGVQLTTDTSIIYFEPSNDLILAQFPTTVATAVSGNVNLKFRNTAYSWPLNKVQVWVKEDACDLVDGDQFFYFETVGHSGDLSVTIPLRVGPETTECRLAFQMRILDVNNVWWAFGDVAEATIHNEAPPTVDIPQIENWFGGVISGPNLVVSNGSGLCVFAPQAGDNLAGWVSPESFVPLVDYHVARVRVTASTNQAGVDAIPFWDVAYDNYNASGFGNNYGGEAWFLDVAGGANGIGRSQGRTTFEMYAAPISMVLVAWRGTDGAVPVGTNGGAFAPEADPYNDMRLVLRVLDIGSGGVNANADSGTICFSRVQVQSIPFANLPATATVWGPPINTATHAAQTLAQAAEAAGVAQIDNDGARANYQLTASGPGSRKTLVGYDPSLGDGFAALYPVEWTTNATHRGVAVIEAGAKPEGVPFDPVDAIFVTMDTPTNELGQYHFVTRGSPGNMQFAGSPRPPSASVGTQYYFMHFADNNRTLSDLAGAARVRVMTDLFNTPEIAPEGFGADPTVIRQTYIETVAAP